MTLFKKFLTTVTLAAILAFSSLALAEEPVNYDADARLSGGIPSAAPHKIADDATSDSCNSCHKTGLKGAPITSHPDRMGCTQCHVQGEIKKPGKKSKGKK